MHSALATREAPRLLLPAGRYLHRAPTPPRSRSVAGHLVPLEDHYRLRLDEGGVIRLWPEQAHQELTPLPSAVVETIASAHGAGGLRLSLFHKSTWTLYQGAYLEGSGGLISNELRAYQLLRHAERVDGSVGIAYTEVGGEPRRFVARAADVWLLGLYSRPLRLPPYT